MIGAIIGDIAGSRFEFDNYRKKDFELFARLLFVLDYCNVYHFSLIT